MLSISSEVKGTSLSPRCGTQQDRWMKSSQIILEAVVTERHDGLAEAGLGQWDVVNIVGMLHIILP